MTLAQLRHKRDLKILAAMIDKRGVRGVLYMLQLAIGESAWGLSKQVGSGHPTIKNARHLYEQVKILQSSMPL